MIKTNFKYFNACCTKLLLIVCIICYACTIANAQKITASINRDKILIGEQVILELKADDIDLAKYSIKNWFVVADTFNHFEIAQRGTIDTIRIGSNTGYVQKIQLTSFDSGYWQIPSFTVELQDKNGGINLLATQQLNVAVLPVDVSTLKDYHDIKDIEEVTLMNDWKIIIAIIIAALISFFGLLWVLSKKRKQTIATAEIPSNLLPHEWALQQINVLLEKQFIEKNEQKLFYTELVGICRNFSDAQLGLKTNTKTTDEYMILLKGRIGSETVQTQYFQFLRLASAVKFAKYIPAKQHNDESVIAAQQFIASLYQYQNK
jgi:hypothetical protein